jgi:WD40 repeat protein
MGKTFLSVMVCRLFIVAWIGLANTVATKTAILPSPIAMLSATSVPAKPLAKLDLKTQTNTAYSLDWSVDGERLAIASGVEVTILRHDLGETIAVLKPDGGALVAAWSPEQKMIATVSGFRNPNISIWNWDGAHANLTRSQQVFAGADQYGISWSPNGKRLATLADDRKSSIQVWDTDTWTLLHRFDLPYANPRRALNWSADGQKIYDAGELNGQVVYFGLNVEDGIVQELGKLPIAQVYAFTVSPDLNKIAVADEGGKVQIFDIKSGSLLTEFHSVNAPVDLAWNPKNATLAILGYETELQLWSISQ